MTNLSGHNDEGEAYLAAIYGGREITANLAAKVAEVRESLTGVDPYVNVGADITYILSSGELHVVRDDREVVRYDIPSPDGYWGGIVGYRVRNTGAYIAIMLPAAEAMFDWPIYRAAQKVAPAQVLSDNDRRLLRDALDYAAEDLQYRVDNEHFGLPEDEESAFDAEARDAKIAAWKNLLEVLA